MVEAKQARSACCLQETRSGAGHRPGMQRRETRPTGPRVRGGHTTCRTGTRKTRRRASGDDEGGDPTRQRNAPEYLCAQHGDTGAGKVDVSRPERRDSQCHDKGGGGFHTTLTSTGASPSRQHSATVAFTHTLDRTDLTEHSAQNQWNTPPPRAPREHSPG